MQLDETCARTFFYMRELAAKMAYLELRMPNMSDFIGMQAIYKVNKMLVEKPKGVS